MGQMNRQTTEHEEMQCRDSCQCVQMEGSLLFRLRTLVGWWWDRCQFFDDCRHHKLIALSEGTSLAKSQLTLLCQVRACFARH